MNVCAVNFVYNVSVINFKRSRLFLCSVGSLVNRV